MATVLYRKLGEQFFDNNNNRLVAGNIYYYQAGTSVLQTTYSDQAGTVPNSNPIPLNGDGRLTVPVYLGSVNDYKELVQDSSANTINPWPFDNIAKAVATAISSTYALTSLPWVFVTSIASPVAPAATDAGKAYECDTTGGNIVFNLVSAATVGTGKGYTFKKTGAANTLTVNANGAELIDGAAALVITNKNTVFSIISDGANWQIVFGYIALNPTVQRFTTGTALTYTPTAGTVRIRVRMIAGGGGGGATNTNNGVTGGTTSFGAWTAIGGNGGQGGVAGAGANPGTGGTGGATGAGTLIVRLSGAPGAPGSIVTSEGIGGSGAGSPFGSGGFGNTVGGPVGGQNATYPGTGGSGGATSNAGGGGGGSGEYLEFYMTSAQIGASQTYTVGAAGTGGAAGTQPGGNGGPGTIIIEEFYS